MDIQKDRGQKEVFIEVSSTPYYPYPKKIPSPSEPMGQIYTERLALSSLSDGNIKWWILIYGWLFYIIIFFISVSIALSIKSHWAIILIVIPSIPLVSMWKGTAKKLYKRHCK